jgi:hypothetical protein
VTFGVQAQVLHGLTLTAGLDIALKSPGYPYAPALVPWNFLFGIGYPIDLVPRIVRNVPVEKIVTKEAPTREGLVAGRVISAAGTPVEGAVVGVSGREHSRVLTDADGTFQSVPLVPGPIELVVVANGFETATVRTEVIAGQTANIVLRLTSKAPRRAPSVVSAMKPAKGSFPRSSWRVRKSRKAVRTNRATSRCPSFRGSTPCGSTPTSICRRNCN